MKGVYDMKDNTNITVRLSVEEKEALLKYAEEQDLTMSQVVRRALKEFLEKQ
jgi:predicted transcriptional regulator